MQAQAVTALLKNDGVPVLHRLGFKNSPCQEEDIIY